MESLLARDILTAQKRSLSATKNRALGGIEKIKGYLVFNVLENNF
jgi:hypothetical protein